MYLRHLDAEIARTKAEIHCRIFDRVDWAHLMSIMHTKRALAFIENM